MRQRYFLSLLTIAAMFLPSASSATDIDFASKTSEELVAYLLFGFERGVPLPMKDGGGQIEIINELESEKPFRLKLAIPDAGMSDLGYIQVEQAGDCRYEAIAEFNMQKMAPQQIVKYNALFDFSKVEKPEIIAISPDSAAMKFPSVDLTCQASDPEMLCQSFMEEGTFLRLFSDIDQIEQIKASFQEGFAFFKDTFCTSGG